MSRVTRTERHIKAPRELVYHLLTDPEAVQKWKVPDGMTSRVHAFDARVGGAFRVSLTYLSQEHAGKTGEHTDTYHGRFLALVPPERVVETMAFESADAAMQGEMLVTYTLSESDSGTELLAVHEHVPAGVTLADNELGWSISMDKLKALAESRSA